MLPSTDIGDQHALFKDAYYIPYRLQPAANMAPSFGEVDGEFSGLADPTLMPRPNLSKRAADYLDERVDPSDDQEAALWWHRTCDLLRPSHVYAGERRSRLSRLAAYSLTADRRCTQALDVAGDRLGCLLDPARTISVNMPHVAKFRYTEEELQRPEGQHRTNRSITTQWGVVQTSGVFPSHGRFVRRADLCRAAGP